MNYKHNQSPLRLWLGYLSAILSTATAPSIGQTSGGGTATGDDGLTLVGREGLCLSEVAPGPFLSYIEILNTGEEPVDLDAFTIESSTGIFSLSGLPSGLPAGERFVLLQGAAGEVGISTDPSVLCIIVADNTCGHLSDTVILRDGDGSVVDAVTYGVTQDISPRYSEAAAAGEFAPGEYLSVANDFTGYLSIGRNARGSDTNRISDWAIGGGTNALVGSPFGPNTAVPRGEDFWIPFFQAFVTSTTTQPYFGVRVVDGSYSGYTGNSQGATVTHTIVFEGDLLGSGQVVMSGAVVNQLGILSDGVYFVESVGSLSDGENRSFAFSVRREISGAVDNLALSAEFTVGSVSYPYALDVARSYTGERGNMVHHITRDLTGWSGIAKTTAATQSIQWSLDATGCVATTTSSATYTRPYPLSDGWVGNIGGTPDPVITTETGHIDMVSTRTAGGVDSEWTKYELHFANGNESVIGRNISTSVYLTASPSPTVHSSLVGELGGDGSFANLQLDSQLQALPGEKLYRWTSSGSLGGVPLPTTDATFDPPAMVAAGFWSSIKDGIRTAAKAVGCVAMYTVGAVGCVGTTVGAAAAGGVSSVASLGTASLGAVALGAAGVTACAGLIKGADLVCGEIWDA